MQKYIHDIFASLLINIYVDDIQCFDQLDLQKSKIYFMFSDLKKSQ